MKYFKVNRRLLTVLFSLLSCLLGYSVNQSIVYKPGATIPAQVQGFHHGNKVSGSYYSGPYSIGSYNGVSISEYSAGANISTSSSATYSSYGGGTYSEAASYSAAHTTINKQTKTTIITPPISSINKGTTSLSSIDVSSVNRRQVYVAGESIEDEEGNYYLEEDGSWRPIPNDDNSWKIGDKKKFPDGKWYYWNGNDWVEMEEVDMPIGELPWLIYVVMLMMYILFIIKRQERVIQKR